MYIGEFKNFNELAMLVRGLGLPVDLRIGDFRKVYHAEEARRTFGSMAGIMATVSDDKWDWEIHACTRPAKGLKVEIESKYNSAFYGE